MTSPAQTSPVQELKPTGKVVIRETAWFKRQSIQTWIGNLFVYLLLLVLSVAALLPMVWMISTSLKDTGSIFLFPPQWIPKPVLWSNYYEALTFFPFGRYFLNTTYITIANLVGTLATSSLVAYAFARYQVPGKEVLFLVVLSAMFLPQHVTLIPLFLLFTTLGWIDTYHPLIVPAFFGGAPLYIFLLRQFFMTIPFDLDEAARIDGCSDFGILWQIILPLSKPALATVAIFTFMGNWNEFLLPLIYLNSAEKLTVTLGLTRFVGQYGSTLWNLLMAASLMAVLPPVIIFFLAQRYFVQGIVMTGIKG